MSDSKINEIDEQMRYVRELGELKKKEFELKKHSVESKYEEVQESRRQIEALSRLDITRQTPEYIQNLANKSTEYLQNSRKRANFIVNIEDFNKFIPFFPKNLIVIGAHSGEGKSTCCANIAYSQLIQGKRPIIITNEEAAEDVYNRVAALFMGVRYGNHDTITDEQIEAFNHYIKILPERMTVIDDAYGSMNSESIENTTTSIEGLEFILSKLLKKQAEGFTYDSVIIDYFQTFHESKAVPSMDSVKVLTKVAAKLDQFKNHYHAPIVVFSQLKSSSSENSDISVKDRIEHCKNIYNRATSFIELKAIRSESASQWIIHKSRWSDYPNKVFVTGWDKGKYVPMDEEFKKKILERKSLEMQKKLDNLRNNKE